MAGNVTLKLARKQRFAYAEDNMPESERLLRQALDQQLDELFRFVMRLRQDVTGLIEEFAGFAGFSTSEIVQHAFTSVGTDETVTHSLGVVPTHLIQVRLVSTVNAGIVYGGSASATSTDVTLRCTQTGIQAVVLLA